MRPPSCSTSLDTCIRACPLIAFDRRGISWEFHSIFDDFARLLELNLLHGIGRAFFVHKARRCPSVLHGDHDLFFFCSVCV